MRLIGVLLVPPVVITAVFAKDVLGFFGPDYVNCSTLLIVMLLTTFPDAVINISMSILRVQQRLRIITVVTVAQALFMVGTAWLLMWQVGVVGAALAAVTAQTLTAATFIAIWRRRFSWESPPPAKPATPEPVDNHLVPGGNG